MFSCIPLPDDIMTEMQATGVWNPACPIPLERLRLIRFSHYTFDSSMIKEGEMVIMDCAATAALNIFKELFAIRFPIHQAKRLDYYKGDDNLSLADNNSSCFNYREITGGGKPSLHAYGLAIDINPIQNPYIAPLHSVDPLEKMLEVLPVAGIDYLNRTNHRPGMAEEIVSIFKKYGFRIWGGEWNTPLDYQHFQTSRPFAEKLAGLSFEEGMRYFQLYAEGRLDL